MSCTRHKFSTLPVYNGDIFLSLKGKSVENLLHLSTLLNGLTSVMFKDLLQAFIFIFNCIVYSKKAYVHTMVNPLVGYGIVEWLCQGGETKEPPGLRSLIPLQGFGLCSWGLPCPYSWSSLQ